MQYSKILIFLTLPILALTQFTTIIGAREVEKPQLNTDPGKRQLNTDPGVEPQLSTDPGKRQLHTTPDVQPQLSTNPGKRQLATAIGKRQHATYTGTPPQPSTPPPT